MNTPLEVRSSELMRVLDALPHGIQENDLSGRIVVSNRAHAEMHGYDSGGLLGKYIWELVRPGEAKETLPHYLRFLVEEQPRPTPAFNTDLTRDGGVVDVRVDWNYRRDESGEVIGFASVITDLTAAARWRDLEQLRRASLDENVNQLQQKIAELERDRERLQRLALVGGMAARAAHEINNPLANAIALLTFPAGKGRTSSAAAESELRRLVLGELDRIKGVTGQMYDLLHPALQTSLRFDLTAAVRDLATIAQRRYRQLESRIELSSTPPVLLVDLPLNPVKQIIANFLSNAFDVTPRNGTIWIEVAAAGRDVRVTVTDAGPGVAPELFEKIFEPFFSTKSDTAVSGLGVGLAVARAQAESMGARIEVQNAVGRGAMFSLVVPNAAVPEDE